MNQCQLSCAYYLNGTPIRDHLTRKIHPCTNAECTKNTTEGAACSLAKVKRLKDELVRKT